MEGQDAVLKCKGLPYSCTREQIREFFKDYKVKAIEFVSEPDGRPSGLGFVEFESKEEALKALSRNGEYIGERYVRLLHVPKSEMEEQVRLGTLAVPGAAAKLRSRLLRSQQARVAGYLAPQMHVLPTSNLMAQPGVQHRPLMALQPHQPGTLLAAYASPGPHSGGAPQLPMDTRPGVWNSYHPAGGALPLHQQFAGLSIAPATQQRNVQGGFSLLSPSHPQPVMVQHQPMHQQPQQQQQVQQLQQQHIQYMSSGIIPHAVTINPMPGVSGAIPSSSSGGSAGSQRTSLAGQLPGEGLPLASSGNRPHHQQQQAQQQQHFAAVMSHQLAPSGAPHHHHQPASFPGQAMTNIGSNVHTPTVMHQMATTVYPMLTTGMMPQMSNASAAGLLGAVHQAAPASLDSSSNEPPSRTSLEICPPTSSTVKVRGLPYRSSPADILGFFSGFQYLPDSLQIGLDASGRPSGEAWLTFANPSEAGRAVKTLNRRYLGTRYLELSCCTV